MVIIIINVMYFSMIFYNLFFVRFDVRVLLVVGFFLFIVVDFVDLAVGGSVVK